MDILDTLLSFAQLSGSINVQCHFQQEWYVEHQAEQAQGIVHIVTHGSSYLKFDNNEKARIINKGDIIFFPRTIKHILSNQADCNNNQSTITSSNNGAFILKKSGFNHSPDLTLFCAKFSYDRRSDLFNNLPDIIILNLNNSILQPILSILQQEAKTPQYGATTIVNSLSGVLLILLIRTYLEQEKATLSGMLNGLRDKRLYKVMNKIIQYPEQNWHITQLTEIANISRAQLIRLFNQQIGFSPYAFVNHIRLQKAAKLLRSSQENILTIALNCGFQSETNFGKAFKKYFGVTASEYRKNKTSHI
ncbi:AraC family transcriptional regulator [Gallibacterium genomosp. 3]|uniref:AraC family transcriptional regulator n=1 Tax=Gallibacterium genomosp. 3 TaxID=505345 RepID=A0A1A7PPK3_9PAST|nr:AraC family transcriptional regulator [Gallibacterium genomosp. 3]OBX03090.1 AraC family transcriptional regulator [Gallibacterium genomosp. 3]